MSFNNFEDEERLHDFVKILHGLVEHIDEIKVELGRLRGEVYGNKCRLDGRLKKLRAQRKSSNGQLKPINLEGLFD